MSCRNDEVSEMTHDTYSFKNLGDKDKKYKQIKVENSDVGYLQNTTKNKGNQTSPRNTNRTFCVKIQSIFHKF